MKLAPLTAKPGKEEPAGRLQRLRSLLERENLDYYVSFSPANIYYLTNFYNYVHERPFILVIPKKGLMKMVCPKLEASHVEARARCELDLVVYYEFPAPRGQNWYDVYRPLFKTGDRIGIESDLPTDIRKATRGSKISTDMIEDLRLVKTEYEIGRSVHSCLVVKEGMKKLLEILRPGIQEIAVYGATVQAMMGKALLEIPDMNIMVSSFTGAVWPPSISHITHVIPTPFQAMEEGGPSIAVAFNIVDGFGVELERSVFLNKVPEYAKKPFEIMMKARALAYELAKPGTVLEDIDKKVRQVFIDAVYGDYVNHRTGHGLGITGHEGPFVALGDKRKLVPGMIISIEPAIYIKGKGGYRHSDTVLITETGNVNLTEWPDSIEALTLKS